jgi:hypothetical protein
LRPGFDSSYLNLPRIETRFLNWVEPKPWVFARFITKGKTHPLVLKGSFIGIGISLVPQLALNQN